MANGQTTLTTVRFVYIFRKAKKRKRKLKNGGKLVLYNAIIYSTKTIFFFSVAFLVARI